MSKYIINHLARQGLPPHYEARVCDGSRGPITCHVTAQLVLLIQPSPACTSTDPPVIFDCIQTMIKQIKNGMSYVGNTSPSTVSIELSHTGHPLSHLSLVALFSTTTSGPRLPAHD
ncbi:hypothetical protein RSAG8_12537, partial [Rhizoctonia solani AG-8 WAC10335]